VPSFVCSSLSKGGAARGGEKLGLPTRGFATEHSMMWLVRRAFLVLWDAVGWVFALALAMSARADFTVRDVDTRSFLTIVAFTVAAHIAVHAVLWTYRGRHPIGGIDEALNVAAGTALVGAMVFVVDSFVRPQLVPHSVPLLAVPIAIMIAVGSRLAVRLYRERHYRADYSGAHRVIVLGAGLEGQQLLRSMLSDPAGRYLPVALLDDNQILRRYRVSGVSVRGTRADVAYAAAESNADMLVIADRTLPRPVVAEIADAAHDAGLTVRMLPTLDEVLRPLPQELMQEPFVPTPRFADDAVLRSEERLDTTVSPVRRPQAAAQSTTKRFLDIAVCLVVAVIVLPLMLLIAVVLKFTADEVIYRTLRVGRDGQPFTMFKFVTMSAGVSGPRVTERGDPRITGVGHWLRATKLNELPQLINVLKGDMSIVGPRPEDPSYAVHYADRHRPVLAVRPGMTSLAFLRFGDEEAFIARANPSDLETYYVQELLPTKLDIELDYVMTWSLWQDLRILMGTIRTLL
jgi:lipopolysaccharide/colanic/teichoic acid biosynthesis glycosyltransferase